MNEPKFTPGPWAVVEYDDGRAFSASVASDTSLVFHNIDFFSEEEIANAHLISTAPELYEELQSAHNQLAECTIAIEEGRYDEALLHASSMSGKRSKLLARARSEA